MGSLIAFLACSPICSEVLYPRVVIQLWLELEKRRAALSVRLLQRAGLGAVDAARVYGLEEVRAAGGKPTLLRNCR